MLKRSKRRYCAKAMKTLTTQGFIEDVTGFLRARKIFIDSKVTNNITTAYELYYAILNGEGVPALILPKCPKCDSDNLVVKKGCGGFEGHEFCKDCNYERFF